MSDKTAELIIPKGWRRIRSRNAQAGDVVIFPCGAFGISRCWGNGDALINRDGAPLDRPQDAIRTYRPRETRARLFYNLNQLASLGCPWALTKRAPESKRVTRNQLGTSDDAALQ